MIQLTDIIIAISIFIILSLFMLFVNNIKMITVKSPLNNKKYLVRNLTDKQKAANILAAIEINYEKLINYLKDNKSNFQQKEKFINRLIDYVDEIAISEKSEYSFGTSYSINKGKSIVFCIRDENDKLHDINLIMYVALHELSHVACPEYGHGDLFKKVFHFVAKTAVDIGIYSPIDYELSPQKYCGLKLTSSIV